MSRKDCPECKKSSYSAAVKGEWICPYCDTDITFEPTRPIMDNGGEQVENGKSEE